MRAKEFLTEINMSPSALQRAAAAILGAKAGLEFEMIVQNLYPEESDPEPDYDLDERCDSIDGICSFFNDGDHNSRREIRELNDQLTNSYESWKSKKLEYYWENRGYEYFTKWVNKHIDQDDIPPGGIDELWKDEGDSYDEAYADFEEYYIDSMLDEKSFLRDQGLKYMSDVETAYELTWPYYSSNEEEDTPHPYEIEKLTKLFKSSVGREAVYNKNYHSGNRYDQQLAGYYIVEPDSSIKCDSSDGEYGLEFVSPALSINDMISDLHNVCKWAMENDCYTNNSTGLHMNVSIPNFDVANLDYVKLTLLLGDEYVLEQFGREANSFCKSAFKKITSTIANRKNSEAILKIIDSLKTSFSIGASKLIHGAWTEKYTSIGIKDNRIEFRSPGGDWLGIYKENPGKLTNTLLRFVVALDAACDPQKYRQEYLKKLYKLLTPVINSGTNPDSIKIFADYVAGNFSKASLIAWIRELQNERKGIHTPSIKDQHNIYDPGALDGNDDDGVWVIYDTNSGNSLGFATLPIYNDRNMQYASQVLHAPIKNLRVRFERSQE